ncbi:MAG: hypothetical protein RLZZ426_438 [Actinomycetota bacterium]
MSILRKAVATSACVSVMWSGAFLAPTQAGTLICAQQTPAHEKFVWEPTDSEWQSARAIADNMTINQLASATLMIRYFGPNSGGSSLQSASNLRLLGDSTPYKALEILQPSGVAYMRDNAKTARDAAREITLNESVTAPWFATAVDQEGGIVNRLSGDIEPPLAASRIGKINSLFVAEKVATLSAKQLRAAKIKTVFAPVADVRSSVSTVSMSARMLGSDARRVSALLKAQLIGYGKQGVLATVKHFPGLGGVKADTHKTVAVYSFTKTRLCEVDLEPFRTAVATGAPSIMVGHGIYPGLGTAPASGNYKIVTKLLRNEMGYEGIIITDSMTMKGAAANLPSDQNLYRRAINAGNDVILMPGNPRQIRNLIAADLREGRISLSERRISISRVIAWQSARSRVAATLRVYGPGDLTLLNEARTFQAKYS